MKKVVLVTDGFPWAPSEIPFIINELNVLAKNFDVEIVARVNKKYVDNIIAIDLPENVVLHKYIIEDVGRKEKIRSIGYVLSSLAFYKELIRLAKLDRRLCVLKEMHTYLVYAYLLVRWMKKEIDFDSVDIFYTYWNSYATLGLAIEKNNKSRYKLVTRTHGYDLFNERAAYTMQFFKTYVDKKLDKVFFIATQGRKYYIDNFAKIESDKYVVNNIGATAATNIPCKQSYNVVNLVSCSNVIPLKRVEMIANALAHIDDIDIHWTHFGAGPLLDSLKETCARKLSNKTNISYELLGRMDNKDVRNYYDTHYVDFFITTSSSEGSPVSIQEAMAYGIPIIGTDVGEIPDLIKGNGYLLGKDPDVQEVVEAIRHMSSLNVDEISALRNTSLKKWEKEYNVMRNAENFVTLLNSLVC